MIGSKIPRYLIFSLTLGGIVAVAMLSLFYGQYHWLANEITTASAEQHDAFLRDNYEQAVRTQMVSIADNFVAAKEGEESASTMALLNRAITNNETLAGLRYIDSDMGITQAGSLPDVDVSQPFTWLSEYLVCLLYTSPSPRD